MQRAFDAMRMEILQAAALVEALIDFGEDQGIDEHVWYEGKRTGLSLLLCRSPAELSCRAHSPRQSAEFGHFN